MATCLSIVEGVLVVTDPQPSDVASCTMVTVSGTEYMSNPFLLTVDQGAEIGLACMLACAIAWGVRRLADHFSTEDKET